MMTRLATTALSATLILIASAAAFADGPSDPNTLAGYFNEASQAQLQIALDQQASATDLCGYFCEASETMAQIIQVTREQHANGPAGYFNGASQAQLQIALDQLAGVLAGYFNEASEAQLQIALEQERLAATRQQARALETADPGGN